MKDCKVNVLGTTYKIRFRHENEDEKLQELSGYCDYSFLKKVLILWITLNRFKKVCLGMRLCTLSYTKVV